ARGAPRPPLRTALRRSAHRASAASNLAQRDRLELRTARRRGTRLVRSPRCLPRRLRLPGRPIGVPGRGPRGLSRGHAAAETGGQVARLHPRARRPPLPAAGDDPQLRRRPARRLRRGTGRTAAPRRPPPRPRRTPGPAAGDLPPARVAPPPPPPSPPPARPPGPPPR